MRHGQFAWWEEAFIALAIWLWALLGWLPLQRRRRRGRG